jgi:hypothetical protein
MICHNSVLSSPLADKMSRECGCFVLPRVYHVAGLLLLTSASRYISHHTTFKLQHLTSGPKALLWHSAEFRPKAPQGHCVECHAIRDPRPNFPGNGGRKEEGLTRDCTTSRFLQLCMAKLTLTGYKCRDPPRSVITRVQACSELGPGCSHDSLICRGSPSELYLLRE